MQKALKVKGGYRKIDEISFLRAFSITTIVLMHLIQSHIPGLSSIIIKGASLGGTGVHVFFFCSGFGLYFSYLKKKVNFYGFIKRRFGKIYIPYIVVVLLLYFLPFIEVESNRFSALLSHVFLYKMFMPKYYSIFGVFWFISTIFQFYFIFIPLCHFKEKKGNKIFILTCIALSVFWWIITGITGFAEIRPIGSFFLQYLWEFAFGMILADYLFQGYSITINNTILILVAAGGVLLEAVLAFSNFSFGKVFNDIPALFGYGAIALLLYQIPIIKEILLPIDSYSYEWYLVHGAVFVGISSMVSSSKIDNNKYLIAGLCFFASLLAAYAYHFLITWSEKRLIAIINK